MVIKRRILSKHSFQYDDTWTVYNPNNGDSARIVRYADQQAKRGFFYRVDFMGKTRRGMMGHFATAKSYAMEVVKGGERK